MIAQTGDDIRRVEANIQDVEKSLSAPGISQEDKLYWRKEKEQLRKEKEQLRKKEEDLRKKEEDLRAEKLLLLQQRMQRGPIAGPQARTLSILRQRCRFCLVSSAHSHCCACTCLSRSLCLIWLVWLHARARRGCCGLR